MAGEKKITISAEMETKGFQTPVREIRKVSDEITKINKVIRDISKPQPGQTPGLFQRWMGGGKQGDSFGKQISSDIKELSRFQGALEKTGKVLQNSLNKNYATGRRELEGLLRGQDALANKRSSLEKDLLQTREIHRTSAGDPYMQRMAREQAREFIKEIRSVDKQIEAGATKISEKRSEVDKLRPQKNDGGDGSDDGTGGGGDSPKNFKSLNTRQKVMSVTGLVGGATDLLATGADAYAHSIMAPKEYAAGAAQTTAKLYSEITRGDFSSMAALMKNSQGKLANINDKDSNLSEIYSGGNAAGKAAAIRATSNAVGGAGDAVGQSLLAGASLGMLGNPAAGAGRMANGITFLKNAGAATSAAEAQAINKMIEDAKAADPIFQTVAQNAFTKSKSYSRHTRMVGGWNEMGNAIYEGADEGLHDNEVMALQMQLRDRLGETKGNQVFATAAASERMYGVDRSKAAGALTALTDGSSGNVGQAQQMWNDIMARAFAKGIKDSRLKEDIADAVASSRGYGQTGRFDASAIGELMTSMLGKNSTQLDAQIARDAISTANRMHQAGASGSAGLEANKEYNMRVEGLGLMKDIQGLNKGLAKGDPSRLNTFFTEQVGQMFGSMSTEEMEAGGTDDFWKAAIGQDINSLPKQQQDQLRDFVRKRGGNYRGKNSGFLLNLVGDQKIISNIKRLGGGGDLRSSMQNLRQNKGALATLSKEDREAAIAYMAQADFAPTQVVGGTTEEFGKGAGMHWGTVAKGAPPPAGSSGQQTSDNSATRVNEGQAKAAADLFARWGDPKNAAAIDAAAAASGQLILQLNKLGNPNVIGNPTQVLQQTAAAMKALADNAGNLSAALNRLNASSLHIQ